MKDRWSELARRARLARKASTDDEQMPFGFADAVLRRLARAEATSGMEAWAPMLRPALGLAFATAFLCVLLQVKGTQDAPENLLTATEDMIQLAVLER
ncbi:MAG TPA: hypothetical protein VF773_23110 [Verrucomicrobiae bacterium]